MHPREVRSWPWCTLDCLDNISGGIRTTPTAAFDTLWDPPLLHPVIMADIIIVQFRFKYLKVRLPYLVDRWVKNAYGGELKYTARVKFDHTYPLGNCKLFFHESDIAIFGHQFEVSMKWADQYFQNTRQYLGDWLTQEWHRDWSSNAVKNCDNWRSEIDFPLNWVPERSKIAVNEQVGKCARPGLTVPYIWHERVLGVPKSLISLISQKLYKKSGI